MKNNGLFCKKPDRDNPKMICGYSLPCPYHTVIVETAPTRVKSPIPLHGEARRRLIEIAEAFDPDK